MSDSDLVLVVDGGGSAIKASVYSVAARRTLTVAAESVGADYPADGLVEFDTERWWGSVLTSMRRAVAAARQPASDYLGVTCTGMRIPFVLLDKDDDPLAPGVFNVDRRGTQYLDRIRDALGAERLYALTGHWPNAKLGLPKLMWYMDRRPELWRRVRRVLQFHDWLIFRLCGEATSEPSSAAMSQLIDVRRRCWAQELMAALGLDRELFPELSDPGRQIGGLLDAPAREIGLAAGTPVHVGGGDTHLAALGAGAAVPGKLAIVGGSTTPLMLAGTERPIDDHATGPLVSPHVLPGLLALETNAGATGILYTWLRDLTGERDTDGYAALDARAAATPLGARGLIVLGANPLWGMDGWARVPPTTLLGLTPAHSVGDLARAVLESISYAVRANLEALETTLGTTVGSVLFTGGASRSRLTCQLLADVIGRKLVVPDVQEPTAAGGAALVAGQPAVDAGQGTTFTADPARHRAYDDQLRGYLAAYERLRGTFGR